jgi:hypothetical protein
MYKITKLKIFYLLIVIIFIYWFKISIDNWNNEALKHNSEIKKHCPCEKWYYVTKGHFECECK